MQSKAFFFSIIKNREPSTKRAVVARERTGKRSYILPSVVRECCLAGEDIVCATLSFTVSEGGVEREIHMAHDFTVYIDPLNDHATDIILGVNFRKEVVKRTSAPRRATEGNQRPSVDMESISTLSHFSLLSSALSLIIRRRNVLTRTTMRRITWLEHEWKAQILQSKVA